nr:spore coat associated protein CotJA [Qiania dongpingensis]
MEGFKQECTCVLAMGTVPMQPFGEIYEPKEALKQGTMFRNLDLPFFKGGEILGR